MHKTYTLYGITNCDTVKKARKWLGEHHIDYVFHDFKSAGTPSELAEWVATLGWEAVLKKTGTTWRNLPETDKQNLDNNKALHLMQQHYNLIKRPLLVNADKKVLLTGFKENEWQSTLA
ncbi:MAG: ArsC family reductase [Thiotrichales bacterium]|jgi:Spx/MgsR family transcriptional regulator|nr:ArsC family reductase [Thiotrichales bacterium]